MPTDRPLPGYPKYIQGKIFEIIDHYGPAAYVAGGENFNASQVGVGGFDSISVPSPAQSGNYTVVPLIGANHSGNAVSVIKLMWKDANGNEAANNANLSAEIVRLHAWMV